VATKSNLIPVPLPWRHPSQEASNYLLQGNRIDSQLNDKLSTLS